MNTVAKKSPVFPRRAFLAAGLSALFAGGAVGLAILGGQSAIAAEEFQFSRGLTFANGDRDRLLAMLAQALRDDRIHVTILGHTGTTGDADANVKLSEDRAELVAGMAQSLGVTSGRVTARGVGGADPLAKLDDESERAFQSRLARVEVSLQMRK